VQKQAEETDTTPSVCVQSPVCAVLLCALLLTVCVSSPPSPPPA